MGLKKESGKWVSKGRLLFEVYCTAFGRCQRISGLTQIYAEPGLQAWDLHLRRNPREEEFTEVIDLLPELDTVCLKEQGDCSYGEPIKDGIFIVKLLKYAQTVAKYSQ